MAPVVTNTWGGSWSVPDIYTTTQPSNQMLNIAISSVSGGNWLFAFVGWHEVPQLPASISVGDDGSNYWVPVATSPVSPTSATFLLNQNYSFQSGTTTGWTATNGTLTASAARTLGNNAFAGQVVNNGTSATVSITSGKVNISNIRYNLVTGSAYVWFTSAESHVHVDITWYDGGGTVISTVTGADNVVSAQTWTQVVTSAKAPGTAVTATVTVAAGGTPTAANIWYASNAGLAEQTVLNVNPYFAVNAPLTGWTGSGATFTSSTAETLNNLPSIKISPSGTSSQVSLMTDTADLVGITPSLFYTGNAYFYSPTGYYYVATALNWYDGSKVFISTTYSNSSFAPQGEWSQVTVAGQAPTNAAFVGVGVVMFANPKPWDIMYASQVTLVPNGGFSSAARVAIWAAPNVSASTTEVSIAPLSQVTGMAAQVWQVSGMPSWLDVDTTASAFALSSATGVTTTPSQTDLVISAAATNRATSWTIDQVLLNGWSAYDDHTVHSINNVDTLGDVAVNIVAQVTSGGNNSRVYSVNPLNNNPVFAPGTSGWSATNATLAAVSGFSWPNNSADTRLTSNNIALWTPNGTSSTNSVQITTTAAPAVTPGFVYQADAYLFGAGTATWNGYTVTLTFLNSSLVAISSSTSAQFSTISNTWTNNFVIGVAPAAAAFATLKVTQNNTPPTSAHTYIGRGTITQQNGVSICDATATAAIRLIPQTQPAVVNANWPYLKLEAAFGYPSSTPPDQLQYVDISNRLLSHNLKRGRQYELNSLESAEVDFVLRNDDGYLTPNNPASPYTIQAYTPIRLTAIWQGKIYPVFTGFMERWPEVWTDPHWGQVNAVGVDAWAMFVGILPSIVKGERLLDSPVGYWPCADGNSSSTVVNIGLGNNSTPLTIIEAKNGAGNSTQAFGSNLVQLVGDTGTNWELKGLLSSQGNVGFTLTYNGPPLPPINEGVCVAWWMRIPSPGGPITTQTRNAVFTAIGQTGPIIQVWIDTSFHANVTTWNTAGTPTDHTPGAFPCTNITLPMMLNFDNTGFTLYVGNAEVLTGTDSMTTNWSYFSFVGRADRFESGYFCNMGVSHICVFPRELSFSRLVTYNQTGINALAGDFGDWRVSRLLSYMLWPVPHRVYYDVGTSQLAGATTIDGSGVAAAIDNVGTTEQALLYVDKNGYLVYRTRNHALDRGVQAVFGENTAAGEIPYLVDVELDYDPQYVYNDIQVTHQGTPAFGQTTVSSPVIYVKNLTSISSYGDRSQQLTSLFSSVTQSIDLANWLASQYAQPKQRVQSVTFTPGANSAFFSTLLSLDIGDRVTLNRRPVGASSISLDVTIIGVHQLVNYKEGQWAITFDLMPTSIATLTVLGLILNDPIHGQLDDGNVVTW